MDHLHPQRITGLAAATLVVCALALISFSTVDKLHLIPLLAIAALFLYADAKQGSRHSQLMERLGISLALASDSDVYLPFNRITCAIAQVCQHGDPILREHALCSLANVANEVDELAKGRVVFTGTENWRALYENLLLDLQTKVYYSVAWVNSDDYWNDLPGRQSMEFNYSIVQRGFRIERVLILPDQLWPIEESLPSAGVRPWIDEQQSRGIQVSLVREHDLVSEPGLIRDFGIYGNRATGTQELDEQSRTVRFILDFDPNSVKLALQCWEKLSLYAQPYRNVIADSH